MIERKNISRAWRCPNSLACEGGKVSSNASTEMCAEGLNGNMCKHFSSCQTLWLRFKSKPTHLSQDTKMLDVPNARMIVHDPTAMCSYALNVHLGHMQ